MYVVGKTPEAIAKALGITRNCVYHHLSAAGHRLAAAVRAKQQAAAELFAAIWNDAAGLCQAAKTLWPVR
jgi:hypothetical protein